MLGFLTLFVTVYLLMHGYLFFHARRSLGYGRGVTIATVFFSLIMTLTPVLVRLAENSGLEIPARILAWTGYTWMGLLFLFVAVAAFYDVAALLKVFFLSLAKKPFAMPPSYRRKRFLVQVVLVLLFYGYGMYEAGNIRTVHVTIASPEISSRVGRFRVAQISDVHLGLLVREKRLARILEKIVEASPDLVVSTGDLVDGQLDDLSGVEQMLGELNPPFGKLAVTGNHEFYAGIDQSLDFTERAGFMVLRNEAITVNGVAFVGVDDRTAERFGDPPEQSERELLRRQNRNMFTVLLKHRPVVDPESVGLFDLQLSGHAHKGQIFPFNVFTWLAFRYPAGINMLASGYLYVSNGSGTWGPPIRFLAPPEVTIIDLVPGG
ncbi:MAG: metallophosphoesterase [Desulfobulbaceae bacterium]